MVSIVPRDKLREPGMTFLQHHLTRHLHLKVRFSRWEEILGEPAPADDLRHARAIWHYARGRALAARGDTDTAEVELARVRATAEDRDVAALRMEFNTSGAVLGIAAEVLAGQIAAAEGEVAFRAEPEHSRGNGWSLFGLTQALSAQRRMSESDSVVAESRGAW